MASFGTESFTALTDSLQETREARVTIIDIPGGDNFYVDRAGPGPQRMSLNIVLADDGAWAR